MPGKICTQCGAEYDLDQRFCSKDGATLRLATQPDTLVGTVVAERYHILGELGEGGMGKVYLAEHVKMHRKSALKVMRASITDDLEAISRFNREAANASLISHPNVCQIYDFGETADGLSYIAMEFIDGEPLSAVIHRAGALPLERVVPIVDQIADALGAAHRLKIVHRDLKPDNIMIARRDDGTDLVKVVDFGIAKNPEAPEQKLTVSGATVGTPAYMSPEQLRCDRPLDARSDIYSFALVAFKAATGQLPFDGETFQSVWSRLTDAPKAMRERRPDLRFPAELDAVMSRALSVEPEHRQQTAREFADAFRQAAAPVIAARAADEATRSMLTIRGGASASPDPGIGTIVPGLRGASQAWAPTSPAADASASPAAPVAVPVTVEVPPTATHRRRSLAGATLAAAAVIGAVAFFALHSRGAPVPPNDTSAARSVAQQSGAPAARPLAEQPLAGNRGGAGAPAELLNKQRQGGNRPADTARSHSNQPAVQAPNTPNGAAGAPLQSTQRAASVPAAPLSSPTTASAPPAAVDLGPEIAKLRAIVSAPDPADKDLRDAVMRSAELEKRATGQRDSLFLMWYRARAYALLGDGESACKLLSRLRTQGRNTPLAGPAATAAQQLSCPDR